MKVAVITTVSGRHEHLRMQLRGLGACNPGPDKHVVVSMADPAVARICPTTSTVIDVCRQDARLPVGAARNAGATRALDDGADLLVFLDVDCIPDRDLLARYENASQDEPNALLSGPVAYLAPPPQGGYVLAELPRQARGHPGRPTPPPGELTPLEHRLFWSLSFAVTASTWADIGGFHPGYRGYGGEDTDFAELARARGIAHLGVGGAWAYHQWHPAPDPPVQHLHDIVRNSKIFRDRWGWWPMTGWLEAFAQLDLVAYDAVSDEWSIVDPVPAHCT